MSDDLILPLLLGSGVVSAAVSGLLTHYLASTKADKEFKLKRIEELYDLIFDQNKRILTVVKILTTNPNAEMLSVNVFLTDGGWEEIQKRVFIYFPRLRNELSRFGGARNAVAADGTLLVKEKPNPEEWKVRADKIAEIHSLASKRLVAALFAEAKAIQIAWIWRLLPFHRL